MSPAVGGRRDDAARDAIENAATYADDAGVRWRHEDRLAATDQLPAVGDLDDAPVLLLGPDCRDGKHSACTGDGWNETDDMPADCPCTCHGEHGWGVAR